MPIALAAFNVGIECGQLLFVALLLAVRTALTRWRPAVARLAVRPAVYAMGVLAAFWSLERVALWLG